MLIFCTISYVDMFVFLCSLVNCIFCCWCFVCFLTVSPHLCSIHILHPTIVYRTIDKLKECTSCILWLHFVIALHLGFFWSCVILFFHVFYFASVAQVSIVSRVMVIGWFHSGHVTGASIRAIISTHFEW